MMTASLAYVTIHVSNVYRTAMWYQDVFGLSVKYMAADETYCELALDGLTICFSANEWVRQSFPQFRLNSFLDDAPGFHLAFFTDDLPSLYLQALDNGAIALSQPERRPWGRVEASFRDLNGVLINLIAAAPQTLLG